MIHFPGLSDEQALITTLVYQNPGAHARLRAFARALLLLNAGATPAQVTHETSTSRSTILELISRFREGGLCEALLGPCASEEDRVWLTLSPESSPRVFLAPFKTNRNDAIDTRRTSSIPAPAAGRSHADSYRTSGL